MIINLKTAKALGITRAANAAHPRRRGDRMKMLFAAVHEFEFGRLCCKSRKLQGNEFFAKTRNGKQSPICITSIALPKPPVSLT